MGPSASHKLLLPQAGAQADRTRDDLADVFFLLCARMLARGVLTLQKER